MVPNGLNKWVVCNKLNWGGEFLSPLMDIPQCIGSRFLLHFVWWCSQWSCCIPLPFHYLPVYLVPQPRVDWNSCFGTLVSSKWVVCLTECNQGLDAGDVGRKGSRMSVLISFKWNGVIVQRLDWWHLSSALRYLLKVIKITEAFWRQGFGPPRWSWGCSFQITSQHRNVAGGLNVTVDIINEVWLCQEMLPKMWEVVHLFESCLKSVLLEGSVVYLGQVCRGPLSFRHSKTHLFIYCNEWINNGSLWATSFRSIQIWANFNTRLAAPTQVSIWEFSWGLSI